MLSRRSFIAGLGSGLTLGVPLPSRAASPSRVSARATLPALSPVQQGWLREVLPAYDRKYDPFARMLVVVAKEGTESDSTVRSGDAHATRPSLAYAAALLDTEEKWRLERAREILRSVLVLQDSDRESKTYGLWPWSLEEPLSRMSRPDWDWVDFCAISLLMVWAGHRDQLGAELEQQVRSAILHAAGSLQGRRAGSDSANIALLGTGLALLAAQELKDADLRTYARERLRRLYESVTQQGSFPEYNSPAYTILALQELSRMLLLVRDARDRTLISALHDLAWKHAATHFHVPTQQWAGPHGRTYETNLAGQPAALAFLQKACGPEPPLSLSKEPALSLSKGVRWARADPLALSLEASRLPLQCPRKWAKYFSTLDGARQVVETFARAEPSVPGQHNPLVGTTWLHPRFALGSVNRGDLWKQRRPLVAYWGTPGAPRFLRVRFLKDHQDFSSALLFSSQHEGHVLAVVTFATDHGDTHPTLDPLQNATCRAGDLRLSFQFGGELGACTVRRLEGDDKALLIADEQVRFLLRPVADRFGETEFRWDQPDLKLPDTLEAVAYQGAEKLFELPKLGDAFVCFTLSEWPPDQKHAPAAPVQVQRADGRLRARWAAGGRTHDLEVPTVPATFASMNDAFRATVV